MYEFLSDETLKRAVSRSLEIIGEATKKIPADVKYRWKAIEWKQMAGMRDKLIHDYMGVNYLIVWNVAKNIIPVLILQIETCKLNGLAPLEYLTHVFRQLMMGNKDYKSLLPGELAIQTI